MCSIRAQAVAVKVSRVARPAVYEESLGATRTYAVRALRFFPAVSAPLGFIGYAELVVAKTLGGKATTKKYAVVELAVGGEFRGRGFRVTKAGDADARNVFLSDDSRGHVCDCEAFCYESTQRADRRHGNRVGDSCGCPHVDILRALNANGWLPPAGPAPKCQTCGDTGSVPSLDEGDNYSNDPCPSCDAFYTV